MKRGNGKSSMQHPRIDEFSTVITRWWSRTNSRYTIARNHFLMVLLGAPNHPMIQKQPKGITKYGSRIFENPSQSLLFSLELIARVRKAPGALQDLAHLELGRRIVLGRLGREQTCPTGADLNDDLAWHRLYEGFLKWGGTSKSSILIGFSIMNHPFSFRKKSTLRSRNPV